MKKLLGFAILSFAAVFTFARANGGGGWGGWGSSGSVYETPSATVVSISQIPQQTIKVGGTFDQGYHFRMVVNVNNTTDISMGLADWTGIGDRSMASSGNTLFVISEAGVGSSDQIVGHLQGEEFTDTVRVKGKNQIIIDIFYRIPIGSAGGEYKSIYKLKLANNPYGEVTLAAKGQDRNYYYSSDESYEVARLQVKAGDTNVAVNGFTLTNMGSLDVKKYLNNVEVLKDNVVLNNVNFSTSNDKLLISFDPNIIQAKNTSLYTIKIKLKDLDKFSQTIQYKIANADDFDAVDANTNIPVEFVGWFEEVLFYTYQYGDKITLTNGKLASTVYGAAGSTDVVIAEGTVTLNEAIKLNSFDIVASGTGIEEMRIAFGNDEYDGVRQSDKVTFKFSNVYIEKSGDVKIKADLYDDAVGTYSFTPNSIQLWTIGGKYDEYNQPIDAANFVGSMKLSSLRAEAARGSLDNKLSKDQEIKKQDATRVVVFDGDYSARRDNVDLNQFVVKANGTQNVSSTDYVNFYLYVDGDEVAYTDTLNVDEYFDNVEINDGKTVKVKLEAEFYLSNTGDYKYDLTLRGEDDNGNTVGHATDSTIKVKVVEQGSVIVTETPKVHLKDTVVKKDSDIELASFIVKADEYSDEYFVVPDLEQLKFKFVGVVTTGDIRIKVDGTDETVNLTESSDVYELNRINYDLTDGVEVVITHRSELPTATYTLELQEVNNISKTRTYTRKVVPALLKISSQSHTDDETKFVLAVDKESSAIVTGVQLFVGDSLLGTIAGEVQNGDFVEIVNAQDSVKYIDEISYWVDGTQVIIKKSVFNDYFRVGDTYAKIARAK